ncbi:sigma-70 family RNA polymerase sigma factor [Rhizobium rhizogenes]|uniref:sigma-70 family RNA polymerase sigma factor n=1 Tax=Rhizobium rhizogenes TaxID=359 RepID=UPI001573450B|nr:sigma-70 family RNA polymerase sigma factor [Rhizobium rhizogenes]NTF44115.1 sigma-70 family RNA polymerase sigma factor [Rhizobium rhizogenes]
MQTSDIAALISRVAMGDRIAFASLYQTTNRKLFAICLRILKNKADAEEALQEVYIKIWQRSQAYASSAGSPLTWLSTIARNHAIDVIRARKPVADNIDDAVDIVDDAISTPEQNVLMADEGRRIDRCMRELNDTHAKAVRQAYVEGLSYLELAEGLGVPLNTIRTWLRRSLLKLRECMQR